MISISYRESAWEIAREIAQETAQKLLFKLLWKISQKHVLEKNSQLPVFWVSTETENWHWPLWKIRKMALVPQKCILEQNFQLTTPLKFDFPVFWVSMEMENWSRPLWKIGKMAPASQKCIVKQNLNYQHPKVWVSDFLIVNINIFWSQHLINGCVSVNTLWTFISTSTKFYRVQNSIKVRVHLYWRESEFFSLIFVPPMVDAV